MGERLWFELSGIPAHPVGEAIPEAQESIASTRSFRCSTHDTAVLLSALSYHTDHVARKLRDRGLAARALTIVIQASRYGPYALRAHTLRTDLIPATNDTFVLIRASERLFWALYDREVPYNKAGVSVSGLTPESVGQGNLFTPIDERTAMLSMLTDRINESFGYGTLRSGLISGTERWRARTDLRSPEYTTRWEDILHVRTEHKRQRQGYRRL
jgi:DNA polymerase V